MFPKQKSLVLQSFKGIYTVFNTIFGILEIRPKLCQCDDLHTSKLETFCNLYNLFQTHLKVAVLNIIPN